MEEVDIFSNLNIYGWIFTVSLCALIGGWLGARLVVIITAGKMILNKHDKTKPDKTKPLSGFIFYRGFRYGLYKKARKQATTTLLWNFFRILFWSGLVVLIIFWTSIHFFAPPDFTLNNLS